MRDGVETTQRTIRDLQFKHDASEFSEIERLLRAKEKASEARTILVEISCWDRRLTALDKHLLALKRRTSFKDAVPDVLRLVESIPALSAEGTLSFIDDVGAEIPLFDGLIHLVHKMDTIAPQGRGNIYGDSRAAGEFSATTGLLISDCIRDFLALQDAATLLGEEDDSKRSALKRYNSRIMGYLQRLLSVAAGAYCSAADHQKRALSRLVHVLFRGYLLMRPQEDKAVVKAIETIRIGLTQYYFAPVWTRLTAECVDVAESFESLVKLWKLQIPSLHELLSVLDTDIALVAKLTNSEVTEELSLQVMRNASSDAALTASERIVAMATEGATDCFQAVDFCGRIEAITKNLLPDDTHSVIPTLALTRISEGLMAALKRQREDHAAKGSMQSFVDGVQNVLMANQPVFTAVVVAEFDILLSEIVRREAEQCKRSAPLSERLEARAQLISRINHEVALGKGSLNITSFSATQRSLEECLGSIAEDLINSFAYNWVESFSQSVVKSAGNSPSPSVLDLGELLLLFAPEIQETREGWRREGDLVLIMAIMTTCVDSYLDRKGEATLEQLATDLTYIVRALCAASQMEVIVVREDVEGPLASLVVTHLSRMLAAKVLQTEARVLLLLQLINPELELDAHLMEWRVEVLRSLEPAWVEEETRSLLSWIQTRND
ncbi:MAG: uncharacterized protein KVP18_003373 [Porospora cf. gigantea A]|nr:MAG: hypothetical protein KVP18_003373 [Porospora cf. gigantea A]